LTERTALSAADATSQQADLDEALAGRLRVAAAHLLDEVPDVDHLDPAGQAGVLLDLLVRTVHEDRAPDRLWLLLTALCAAYPTREEVDRARRQIELSGPLTAAAGLLQVAFRIANAGGHLRASMEVVEHQVVVDVDHSAKYDLHTGIQRVARSLLPLWDRDHEVIPVAWNRANRALRRLSVIETARVLSWAPERAVQRQVDAVPERTRHEPDRLLVPWRSVVVMIEVPSGGASDRLAAIGNFSGNTLVAVAHDAIPVVSADMVPSEESAKFVQYLTSVKFASRVAAVSRSAAAEMAGFVTALATQGLEGPLVTEVALGSPEVPAPSGDPTVTGVPDVLVVGSHEPRKNHLAVLHAADVLWREGASFSLIFIGGSGWGTEFPERVAELQKAGRPVDVRRGVSDADLAAAYRSAAFTVFPSLHEGFGLPVAESIAFGTPVITTDFGATAETAFDGGAVLVDPWDDDALIDAMRILLTDPVALRHLREEARHRVVRDWHEYATELWAWLVEPEMGILREAPAP
jgi:glycosyltransferase involved in cell wall biosynthesis